MILPRPVAGDFRYGDPVSFAYCFEAFGDARSVRGRVGGRLSRASACNLVFAWEDNFVLLPSFGPWPVDEELAVNFVEDRGRIELDWGRLPDSDPVLVAPGTQLTHVHEGSIVDSFVARGCCPRCGDRGTWVNLGLSCPWHGPYL